MSTSLTPLDLLSLHFVVWNALCLDLGACVDGKFDISASGICVLFCNGANGEYLRLSGHMVSVTTSHFRVKAAVRK